MRWTTLALCAALLFSLAPSASTQDKDVVGDMKWQFVDGDKFDFKWTFNETRHREPGRGTPSDSHDKRDVDGELSFKQEGLLLLTLKKVVWSYGSQDFEVSLNWTEGKKNDAQTQLKAAPGSGGYAAAKGELERILDVMKKVTETEFAISTEGEKGRTLMLASGIRVQGGAFSLFDRLFTHPLLGSGPFKVGQSFKDPFDASTIAPGLVDVNTLQSKVTAVGEKGVVCKGGFNSPIGKQFTANGQVQNLSGSLVYNCEWSFAKENYLQRTAEDMKLTKKVDAKGKDAAFYNENFVHTFTQALTIKKKAPKPGEEKKKPAGEEGKGEK